MNALELLFEINALEGELVKILIDYRLKLAKLHGLVNLHYWAWEPTGTYDVFTSGKKSDLHQRIKSLRREISSLIAVARMDKKYG